MTMSGPNVNSTVCPNALSDSLTRNTNAERTASGRYPMGNVAPAFTAPALEWIVAW
jgi:hypothetical protein